MRMKEPIPSPSIIKGRGKKKFEIYIELLLA